MSLMSSKSGKVSKNIEFSIHFNYFNYLYKYLPTQLEKAHIKRVVKTE